METAVKIIIGIVLIAAVAGLIIFLYGVIAVLSSLQDLPKKITEDETL